MTNIVIGVVIGVVATLTISFLIGVALGHLLRRMNDHADAEWEQLTKEQP